MGDAGKSGAGLCGPDLAECTLKIPAQDEFDIPVGILAPDEALG